MTQFPEFRFQGFLLRAALGSDLPLAAEWTRADADHATHVDPTFWIVNNGQTNSFVLEDSIGRVFFFRIDRRTELKYPAVKMPAEIVIPDRVNVCDLHIQFPPHDQHGSRLRTMQGMAVGFDWLKKILGQNGYDAVYFTSKNQRLISFAMQRLEFIQDSVTDGETRLKAYLAREPET